MYIDQQIGFGKFQFTRLRIQMGGVGTYIYDIGYEHVVRTESNYFLYPHSMHKGDSSMSGALTTVLLPGVSFISSNLL